MDDDFDPGWEERLQAEEDLLIAEEFEQLEPFGTFTMNVGRSSTREQSLTDDIGPEPQIQHVDFGKGVEAWRRPDVPLIHPTSDSICNFIYVFLRKACFSVSTIGHRLRDRRPKTRISNVWCQRQRSPPEIMIFSKTLHLGNSVCTFVHGFEPYFYIEAPPDFTVDDLPEFKSELTVTIKHCRFVFDRRLASIDQNRCEEAARHHTCDYGREIESLAISIQSNNDVFEDLCSAS